ncbi:hypothetical protein THASP1DRAFT_27876 [Thamnocephalis sphaerospora]|uniref:NFACT RNA-binding domain-containing protein n=1 Tax=Thamnocephalis sphaerospora TaxID=78915 RepID=A0A4P9XVP1_9FUNG|nr:hypothetical protein THASP1DRAFT_27876 [Thamnocephalis sphaerospora]|eukprot:RKP10357.1 hypothetical protein THASP1DRAFT_27876 [Thamnocephalis sphaerospora]
MIKHEKTMAHAKKAFESAEKKIRQDLKQIKITATINKMRKPFWFEKFLWFISSDGYMIIAGRDMQQNELIVKRHLGKDDKYVHADLHGAATVVIKNPHPYPPPPSTLFQAGVMSVCQSRAWEAKMLASAYWVNADQVSKTAPSGEYLTTGSFMIRGKRNFLPPVNLVYGFGFMFKIDESCVAAHVLLRREAEDKHSGIDATAATEEEQRWRERHSHYEYVDEQGQAAEGNGQEDSQPASNTAARVPASPLAVSSAGAAAEENTAKYKLDDHGSEEEGTIIAELLKPTNTEQAKQIRDASSKKRLSAKERRDLKKGKGKTTTADDDIAVEPTAAATPAKEAGNQKKMQKQPKQSAGKIKDTPTKSKNVRGKKARKANRDAWPDSDEDAADPLKTHETLTTAEEAEAVSPPEAPLCEEQQAAEEEEEEEEEEISPAAEAQSLDDSDIENDTPEAGQLEDAEEQEEVRRLMAEENIKVLEDEDKENLSFLDALVGSPLPDDILHFAIPVCAPYAALQRCKYRIKLQPGSLKKGKACKTALDVFLKHPSITQRERELLKSVPETEQIAAMLPKVRVVTGAGEGSRKNKPGGGRR